MKKLLIFLMVITACFTITACEKEQEPTTPPTTQNQPTNPENGGETEENTENSGGNAISPIKPGGDFEVGGNYGK